MHPSLRGERYKLNLNPFLIISGLLSLTTPPAIAQSLLKQADPRTEPALIHQSSMEGFQTITIDGYIHKPTVSQFEKAFSMADGTKGIIYFNSDGGDIEAAMRLGRLIRKTGYAVQVGKISVADPEPRVEQGVCMSACPVAFFGGKYRFFDTAHGPLGVHQISKAVPGRWIEDTQQIRDAEAQLSDYLVEMGIDLELLDLIRKTPSQDMAMISPTQARYWNIATNAEVSDWKWDASRLVGTVGSTTSDTKFQLWCEAGSLKLQVDMKPWFPTAALLNYDTHSVTFNGRRMPVSEVRVSFDMKSESLQMLTHLTPDMIAALDRTVRLGYALDYEGRQDGYHRSIPVKRRPGAELKDLVEQCTEINTTL